MKNTENKKPNAFIRVLKTLGRWIRRMFLGASKDLVDVMEVEKLESPSKMAVKTFFRRKLAVAALIVLIAEFLFVFIGPAFFPMDLNYIDNMQANKAPNMSMLSVPSELDGDIRLINSTSSYSVGVSEHNTLYMWGATKDALTKMDLADFPAAIEKGKVHTASAGYDHVVAVTTDGRVVGWGNNGCGQYGDANEEDGYISMNRTLSEAGFVKVGDYYQIPNFSTDMNVQIVCGYQVSCLVVDGTSYFWGNTRACLNLGKMASAGFTDVDKVVFTNYNAMVLKKDGSVTERGALFNPTTTAASSDQGKVKGFANYIRGQKVVDIAATKDCFAFLTDKGELLVQGSSVYGESDVFISDGENVKSIFPADEKVVEIEGGSRHLLALTDKNTAYAWGQNEDGQCDVNGEEADRIYAGAMQSYLVDDEGSITEKSGLKGYLFGTDGKGRGTFTRLVHGGKMTMTIGAVAVIVSTVIAIIVGCVSGYFGGWVDMLLMRVTEIVSSIPFLPFAMMLSYVMRTMSFESWGIVVFLKDIGLELTDENIRIFIIMFILGILSWTGLARMIRGQVLAEREKEFVTAAKAVGVKESGIAFRHILPNVVSIILVSVTLDFAGCLLTESSLSYLGFGVQQPQPTWGNMLDGANNSIVIQNYWWQWLFPALFLAIATISINIIGDTLRDVLDPKSSREK